MRRGFGDILLEQFIPGMIATVGILVEEPLPILELVPRQQAFYDYEAKYTRGETEFVLPARLDAKVADKIKMPMMLSSAKTGENVEAVFKKIGELMLSSDFVGEKSADMTAASIAQAVDDVVDDFCEQYGDTTKAMELVEREFTRAKVDVNNPTKESLLMAIEYLSDVERDVHGRDVSEVNKLRRWKMIDEAR